MFLSVGGETSFKRLRWWIRSGSGSWIGIRRPGGGERRDNEEQKTMEA